MDKQPKNDEFAGNDSSLATSIKDKINYLNELDDAIAQNNDLRVYELIGPNSFHTTYKHEELDEPIESHFPLATDLTAELSHHLSDQLIKYLAETYPFFYYHEFGLGKFNIYFGNWWDRRLFGELDVIGVKFNFDETEYQKLATSFELESENKRVNDDEMQELASKNEKITKLINEQNKRDSRKNEIRDALKQNDQKTSMPWESGKLKDEHQQLSDELLALTKVDEKATNGRTEIKQNENQILALSKEETIYSLEKQNIRAVFGSFDSFIENNNNLYASYLQSLDSETKVNSND